MNEKLFIHYRKVFIAVLLVPACTDTPAHDGTAPVHADYAGTYVAGPLATLEIGAVEDLISAVPPFWGAKPYLHHVEGETFAFVLPHPEPERRLTFERGPDWSVTAVVMTNVDGEHDGRTFRRLPPDETTPALLFMDGRPAAAAEAALADPALALDNALETVEGRFMRHPSRHIDTAVFLETLAAAHPDDARIWALIGHARVATDDRAAARAAFDRAVASDPDNQSARSGLRVLDLAEPLPGEGYRAVLPYRLVDAFARPTEAEVAEVRAQWAARDLSARDIEVLHRFELEHARVKFDVRVVRHRGPAGIHVGAVLVPEGAEEPLPVVIDARGVDPSYSPLDLTDLPNSLVALGDAAEGFVILAPAYRGNRLLADGREFVAEGDPSDAWDGATDDALAFLNAALDVTPRADPSRVAILGKSRGGTVALLAGIRDSRVSLVLDVVGPVDQFAAQDPHIGWTWAELLAADMADGEPPVLRNDSGQKFDHFFDRGETLAEVRRRMLASSPLYFVDDLPEMHAWYGADDTSVPIANPRALEARLRGIGRLGEDATVTVLLGRGHDTDPYLLTRDVASRLTAWSAR